MFCDTFSKSIMAKIDKNQRSWNPRIGRVVKHKEKLEWCQQLYIRHCMQNTPSLGFCRNPSYFSQYNQYWNILRAGWCPSWDDIAYYPEEVELDDIITIIDKHMGFVDIEYAVDKPDPEPTPEELEWYDEDQMYQKDVRSKSREFRKPKKFQKYKHMK